MYVKRLGDYSKYEKKEEKKRKPSCMKHVTCNMSRSLDDVRVTIG